MHHQTEQKEPPWRVAMIVSGGQTGVDRGALDAALQAEVPHGGWCPAGRKAEDGRIPDRYQLTEHASPHYAARTAANVRDSDATLILAPGEPTGGTALTRTKARAYRKPCLVVDLLQPVDLSLIRHWLAMNRVHVLNVAGPREKDTPGVAAQAQAIVSALLAAD